MNAFAKNRFSSAALIAGMAVAAWSPSSYACSADSEFIASICIMAVPYSYGGFNRSFVVAAGQSMPINSNAALYSLIGTNFGGDGKTQFNLPDLRGKFVIGADGANYRTGTTGGKSDITLTVAQLPPHVLQLAALPVDLSKVTVATTLPSLSGTVNIASAVATGTVSNLKFNVSTAAGGTGAPAGNYLGRAPTATSNIYTTTAPDAALNAGAISGGTASVTIPASTAPVTLPATSLPGVLGGTATVTGSTSPVGNGATIDIRPPYVALTYYIATTGLYPSRD